MNPLGLGVDDELDGEGLFRQQFRCCTSRIGRCTQKMPVSMSANVMGVTYKFSLSM
jgi:hypothetical protein